MQILLTWLVKTRVTNFQLDLSLTAAFQRMSDCADQLVLAFSHFALVAALAKRHRLTSAVRRIDVRSRVRKLQRASRRHVESVWNFYECELKS